MDGDKAPLTLLSELASCEGAVLVIDEAHSTGLFGDMGRGLAHEIAHLPYVLCLHTCGKALGVSGALICGPAVLIEVMVNKARAFIFATAPSPLNAALVRGALKALQEQPDLRAKAWANIRYAWAEAEIHCGLTGFQSQILPVVIGDDKRTMTVAAALQYQGFDIRGIRPPTVPRGTSRLRISITPTTAPEVITRAFASIAPLLAEVAA
jgi:8-amino-7-oxononanoate synthase